MRTFVIVGCAIFSIIAVAGMIKEGLSWTWVGSLIFFGGGGISVLYDDKLLDAGKRREKAKLGIVQADHIYFPKGYYFRFGYLRDRKKLEYAVIDEIRLNTNPVTAKINGNEVVFLRGCEREEVVEFAKRYNIPVREPQDNWALICYEFLDTEIDASIKENMTRSLVEFGIDIDEQRMIKKRISFRMLIRAYVTWEWMYYGQYEVLSELWPLTETKYWWTMDIALRKRNRIET